MYLNTKIQASFKIIKLNYFPLSKELFLDFCLNIHSQKNKLYLTSALSLFLLPSLFF